MKMLMITWAVVSAALSAQAQTDPSSISPLPLAVGNHWVMGVSPEGTPIVFAEVTGVVRLRPTATDTAYSSFSDAVDSTGQQYFILRIVDYMRLFPVDPDTAIVRMDEHGNIWCRAIVDREEGLTRVASTDQPWLMVDGRSTWNLRIDDYFYSIRFSLCGDTSMFEDVAKRYVDDVTSEAGGRHRLLQICGQMDGRVGISEGGDRSNLVLLTGVGPMWIPLPTTETELLGLHWELREARLEDERVAPRTTSVGPRSWGGVKREAK